jgi:predicted transcriptional regulator
MSSSDNITALAENKVLILYTLSQIQNGLSNDGLYKIISSINDVNYFYFKEVLTDLLDSKLVGMFTKDEEDESVLKITSEGKNALSLTIDVLPGILKLKADNVFQKEFSSIADETSIIAEFIPRSENDYTIKCKVIEKNETIFEVRTFAGSRDRAKKIVDNWNKNASKIYPKILDLLLED